MKKRRASDTHAPGVISQRRLTLIHSEEIEKVKAVSKMMHMGTENTRRMWKMCVGNQVYTSSIVSHLTQVMDIEDDSKYRLECEDGVRKIIVTLHDRGFEL